MGNPDTLSNAGPRRTAAGAAIAAPVDSPLAPLPDRATAYVLVPAFILSGAITRVAGRLVTVEGTVFPILLTVCCHGLRSA